MRQSVRSQIILFLGAIFTVVFLLVLIPSALYIKRTNEKDMEFLAKQTLKAIDANLVSKLDELNKITNIVMINQTYQSELEHASDALSKNRVISDALFSILLYDSSIMSVVYCDQIGAGYYQTNSGARFIIDKSIVYSQNWKTEIKQARGELVYFPNGGGAITDVFYMSDEYVSFVRDINRLTDYSSMGTLMLNITKKNLATMLFGKNNSETEVFILDSNRNIVTSNSEREVQLQPLLTTQIPQHNNFYTKKTASGKVVVSALKSQYSGWTIVSITPLSFQASVQDSYYILLLAIALMVIVLIVVGQLYLSNLVVSPITRMAKYMKYAEHGQFKPMNVTHSRYKNEITDLQDFYNEMIVSIDNLTKRIKKEERLKRKNEMALLQEQIKPHFLYNALDAISALTLLEDTKTAYELTQALSGFYRTSLSLGYDTVSVGVELDCVRDYIKVLNIRYKNKIKLKIDAPPSLLHEKTIKLVLQPLVENAVYHGLRQREGMGNILITVRRQQDKLVFTVQDDGVGMSEERVREVLQGKSRQSKHGFGIYNLKEKLRLAGGAEQPVCIASVLGKGTTVEITMPVIEDD